MSDKLKIMQRELRVKQPRKASRNRIRHFEDNYSLLNSPAEQTGITSSDINSAAFQTPWGIDVSHHNGNIDWNLAREAGVEFAFMKATEGVTFVDKRFERNYANAKAAGILVGAYHFFQPKSAVSKQVDNLTRIYDVAVDGDLPPVIDVEDASLWRGLSKKESADRTLAFIDGVRERLGSHVHPVIYASTSFVGDVLGSDVRLKEHPLWLAHYTSASRPRVPAPYGFWTFWQYTDRGRVAGISGNVDINRFNGDRGRLEALLVKK